MAISFGFLDQFRVNLNFIFADQAGLGECVALWFALTPPPFKWLTEQKNPFEVCKHAAGYKEFGYKLLQGNQRFQAIKLVDRPVSEKLDIFRINLF